MNFKIDYEIQREDYSEFNKYHFLKTKLKKTIISGSIFLVVLQIFLNRDEFNLIPTIISIIVFVFSYFLIIRRSLNRTNKIPLANGKILGKKELIFSDTEIVHSDISSNGTIQWTAIKNIQKGKTAYYLYMDTLMAIVIPYRYFKDNSERKDFENFIEERINNA